MDDVIQVYSWEWDCINAIAVIAFFAACAYIGWYIVSELKAGKL